MKTVLKNRRRQIRRGSLDGREWIHVHTPPSRGLVFAPPLIGGSAGQQMREFRGLIQKGYDLFTFSFSGHGSQPTSFSLRTSVHDTVDLLSLALNTHRHPGASVFGIAACFGAIPMVKALEILGEPLEGLVLINALPELRALKTVASFWEHHRSRIDNKRWRPEEIKASLSDFLDRLFPRISKTASGFGQLARQRVRLLDTLLDLMAYRPLDGLRLVQTPVLCLYARDDLLLKTFWNLEPGGSYEIAVQRVCPDAIFLPVEGDHFLKSGKTRSLAVNAVEKFLSGGAGALPRRRNPFRAISPSNEAVWSACHVET